MNLLITQIKIEYRKLNRMASSLRMWADGDDGMVLNYMTGPKSCNIDANSTDLSPFVQIQLVRSFLIKLPHRRWKWEFTRHCSH